MDDSKLQRLLTRQSFYNARIRREDNPPGEDPYNFWTAQYLLGLVSEVDEILNAIKWKRHRKGERSKLDVGSLGLDLADLFKYVISIYELWGFDAEDILKFADIKSTILEEQWKMENSPPPIDRNIVVTDIDGTLADWRTTFLIWLEGQGIKPVIEDNMESMLLDADLQMMYPDYARLKEEFESTGGYSRLIPFPDSIKFLREVRVRHEAYVSCYTARPAGKFRTIWYETFNWLKRYDLTPDYLSIGHEPRILSAKKLMEHNRVIMMEDDPGLMRRAAHSGITVYAKRFPYNYAVEKSNPDNIVFVDEYTDLRIEEIFK